MESYVTAREKKKVRTHAAVMHACMEWSEMIQGEQLLSHRYTQCSGGTDVMKAAAPHARAHDTAYRSQRDAEIPLSFLAPDRMRASGPCWHDAARARGQGPAAASA